MIALDIFFVTDETTPSFPSTSSTPSIGKRKVSSSGIEHSDEYVPGGSQACTARTTSLSPSPSPRTLQGGLDRFTIRTTAKEKNQLDLQIARFIFGTNSAFRHVEHPEFVKMVQLLRPGYKPPNRKQISNELLDVIYNEKWTEVKKTLTGKSVCMALDGWSNVHNDPIVCVSVSDVLDRCTHLTETIDTEDNSHTSDYLLLVAERSIKNCQQYGCKVRSFVTDNAANMGKMREELAKKDIKDVITYGCSAHLLNLLAHDLEVVGITEHIKKIIKYFKNTHFASAKYKQVGGTALSLPTDVRWNSLADCIESYLNNWHIIAKVCTENRSVIEASVSAKVNNVNLKQNAQDYLKKLKTVSVSLDKVQRDDCTIGEAVEVWLDLHDFF